MNWIQNTALISTLISGPIWLVWSCYVLSKDKDKEKTGINLIALVVSTIVLTACTISLAIGVVLFVRIFL